MLNKKTSFIINGNRYEVCHLPAMYNTNLFIRFVSLVGGSLSKFFALFTNTSDWSVIGEAINTIMVSISEKDSQGLIILEIMSQTTRNEVAINKDTFDQFYTGNITEMTEALFETMRIHFQPFLSSTKLSGYLIKPDQPPATSSVEN